MLEATKITSFPAPNLRSKKWLKPMTTGVTNKEVVRKSVQRYIAARTRKKCTSNSLYLPKAYTKDKASKTLPTGANSEGQAAESIAGRIRFVSKLQIVKRVIPIPITLS